MGRKGYPRGVPLAGAGGFKSLPSAHSSQSGMNARVAGLSGAARCAPAYEADHALIGTGGTVASLSVRSAPCARAYRSLA
jgi:hypothetical protein